MPQYIDRCQLLNKLAVIRFYRRHSSPPRSFTVEDCLGIVRDFPSAHLWIPVTERLPEPGWYLVRCNEVHKHAHRIAYYYNSAWHESNNITEFVTHWISLPEPPKEG